MSRPFNVTADEFHAEVRRVVREQGMREDEAESAIRRSFGYLNRPDRSGGPLGVSIDGVVVEPHPEDRS